MMMCAAPSCPKHAEVRGFCMSHYRRWKKSGQTSFDRAASGEHMRFIEASLGCTSSDCLEWPFGRSQDAYPSLYISANSFSKAHRYMCLRAHGNPPTPTHEALHSCDNKRCVNPQHLRWGTKQENSQEAKDRGRYLKGEGCPATRLTEQDVRAIRAQRAAGLSIDAVAACFGTTRSNVSAIALRKTWAHLT